MSDTYDIAGPLGREPKVWSSTLADARTYPDSYLFGCAGSAFDSHGRLVLSCAEAVQTGPDIEDKATGLSLVLVDPESLAVLAHMHLPPPKPHTGQYFASSYLYLDNHDRSVVPMVDEDGKSKIKVIEVVESKGTLAFQEVTTYDVSDSVPPGDNINGLLADWRGRIWFVVKNAGRVGVLDPVTGSIKTLALEGSITNSFAIDRDAVYVATTQKMYRIGLDPDGVPQMIWEDGYQNIGDPPKPGQLSAGTGTTPTVLGDGKYVAIADNADQVHVVVYRTDEKLKRNEDRIVCEVPVFKQGEGADENSLIGSGRSLIAYNCYGNDLTKIMWTGTTVPSKPGIARVDIDPNGKGCRLVWENDAVFVRDEAMKMSTRTGLVYVVSRKYDTVAGYPDPGLDVAYFTAIDFRTGKVIWERQLGTGFNFDGFEVDLIGPDGTAYIPQFGGLIALRDKR